MTVVVDKPIVIMLILSLAHQKLGNSTCRAVKTYPYKLVSELNRIAAYEKSTVCLFICG